MCPIKKLPPIDPEPFASENDNLTKVEKLDGYEQELSEFLKAYQKGDWELSKDLLDNLILKYPDVVQLKTYDKDLKIQLSLREISIKHTTEKKKKSIRRTANISIFTISLILLILVLIGGILTVIGNSRLEQQRLQQKEEMAAWVDQAQQLLLSGQPAAVLDIIKKIRRIDPDYPELSELQDAADQLTILEKQYQNAIDLVNTGNYEDAQKILEEIQLSRPGLWDVPRQLTLVNNHITISTLFAQAQTAHKNEDWEQVIENYEKALAIDPKLDDPVMKEQLLNGYLRTIIKMLENESSTIQDIDKAEEYYRKAVGMIPQSRTYLNERKNFQQISSSLLTLKYSQTAYLMLKDSNQTIDSISKAVSYLGKASNLSPEDQQLQIEYANAHLYQVGLLYFLNMDWDPAIENLSRLVGIQRDYADGKASTLLYEAFAARGRKYYSVGLYLDARRDFEAAEIIAWEKTANPFKLFDVQIWLGDTLGHLMDYPNAVSYYQYAFRTIDISSHLVPNSDFAKLFKAAEDLNAAGDLQAAYEKYVEALAHIGEVYSTSTKKIQDGGCLAFFAEDNLSTISAIQKVNDLLVSVTVKFSQDLIVPTILK
jgi:tetratricopeptide (TPR) repeat protein